MLAFAYKLIMPAIEISTKTEVLLLTEVKSEWSGLDILSHAQHID